MNLINPYSFAAAGGTFDPLSISGCVLWLKADGNVYNTGTTQATDGQTVATWDDASTAGSDATEATNKPTFETNEVNGLPVIRFDGTNDKLTLTRSSLTNYTLFYVWKLTAYTQYDGPVAVTEASHDNYFSSSTNSYIRMGGSQFNSNKMPSSAFAVFVHKCPNGGTGTCHVDGVASGSSAGATSPSGTTMLIGTNKNNGQFGNVDLAEVLLYNSALSDADREDVEDYLGTKYGITITH